MDIFIFSYFVKMAPADVMLSEVVVKPQKEKYSRKNNPAVDFMRKVIFLHLLWSDVVHGHLHLFIFLVLIEVIGFQFQPFYTKVLNVKMAPADVMLSEVVVKPQKEKYSRKNNPAVSPSSLE